MPFHAAVHKNCQPLGASTISRQRQREPYSADLLGCTFQRVVPKCCRVLSSSQSKQAKKCRTFFAECLLASSLRPEPALQFVGRCFCRLAKILPNRFHFSNCSGGGGKGHFRGGILRFHCKQAFIGQTSGPDRWNISTFCPAQNQCQYFKPAAAAALYYCSPSPILGSAHARETGRRGWRWRQRPAMLSECDQITGNIEEMRRPNNAESQS